jgi:hypothetical protein
VEHDIQPHPYDDAAQNVDRVVRAVCNWEAVCRTVESGALDAEVLRRLAAARNMAAFEDMVRDAVAAAHELSKELYAEGIRRRKRGAK